MSQLSDIITELYNTQANDATIKTLVGNPARIYYERAVKNAKFPYIIHRLENDMANAVVNLSQYILDIYDYETQEDNILDIRDRLVTLFDKNKFSITSSRAIRTNYFSDGPIPEIGENYLHRVLIFTARYGRWKEIDNIIDRG